MCYGKQKCSAKRKSIKAHASMKWKTLNKKNRWRLSPDDWRACCSGSNGMREQIIPWHLQGFAMLPVQLYSESVERLAALLAYCAHDFAPGFPRLRIGWPAVTRLPFHSSQGFQEPFTRFLLTGITKSRLTNANSALFNWITVIKQRAAARNRLGNGPCSSLEWSG